MHRYLQILIFSTLFIFFHFNSEAQRFKKKKPETLYARNKKKNISPIYVGIGTNSPTAQLHTVGNLRFEGLNPSTVSTNILTTDPQGNIFTRDFTSLMGSAWLLAGNTANSSSFLGTVNNEALRIRTNNLQRLIISSGGQVGINVTAPTASFHTNGSVRFEGISSDNSLSKITVLDNSGNLFTRDINSLQSQFWSLTGNSNTNAASNFLGTLDNNRLVFKTNNAERMTLLADGKVGIGTNAPITSFEVYSATPDYHIKATGNGPSLILESVSVGQNIAGRFGFATLSNQFVGGSVAGDVILQSLGATHSLIFGTTGGGTGNGIERMRITANGFVGIGTNSPTARLHTTGNVRFQGLSSGSGNPLMIDANGNVVVGTPTPAGNAWSLTGNSGTTPATNFLGTTDNARLVIRTNNVERMTILGDGRIGIGTSSPASPLEVVNSFPDNHIKVSGNGPSVVLENSAVGANTAGRFGFATLSNQFVTGSIPGDVIVQSLGALNSLIFGTTGGGSGNGVERARFNQAGYFGIATSLPTAKLHVNCLPVTGQLNPSNIRFENLGTGTGNALVIDANGYVYKSNTLTGRSSDQSGVEKEIDLLKKEIEDLKEAIRILRRECSVITTSVKK